MIKITTEDDAPPIVRVFANRLRLSQQRPGSMKVMAGIRARFTLKSARNAQAVTIDVDDGKIHLSHGTSSKSQITITMDFDRPNAGKQVDGLWRHPFLAQRIGKLLALPLPNWAESAERFWAMIEDQPGIPPRIVITCTEEGRSLVFGEGESAVEIHGSASVLEDVLAGNSLIALQVMKGKLRFRGSLKDLAQLSAAGQKIMLGELHG